MKSTGSSHNFEGASGRPISSRSAAQDNSATSAGQCACPIPSSGTRPLTALDGERCAARWRHLPSGEAAGSASFATRQEWRAHAGEPHHVSPEQAEQDDQLPPAFEQLQHILHTFGCRLPHIRDRLTCWVSGLLFCLSARAVGDFPGSQVDLRYVFELAGEKIARLEITLASLV